jgi:hypothetical protein
VVSVIVSVSFVVVVTVVEVGFSVYCYLTHSFKGTVYEKLVLHIHIGAPRGVSKGIEDGRRPPALWAAHP